MNGASEGPPGETRSERRERYSGLSNRELVRMAFREVGWVALYFHFRTPHGLAALKKSDRRPTPLKEAEPEIRESLARADDALTVLDRRSRPERQ